MNTLLKRAVCCALSGMWLLFSSALHAESKSSLATELRAFLRVTAAQCSSVKEQVEATKGELDPLTEYTLKDAVQSLCTCMPAQTLVLMGKLSAQDLASPVSEVEVMAHLKPYAFDNCAGEQIREMYGAHCTDRFRSSGVDAHKYCACMKKTVSGYSNGVTAAIASAAADYIPKAAEAENRGERIPARPPILEVYFQADKACKGAAESKTATPVR